MQLNSDWTYTDKYDILEIVLELLKGEKYMSIRHLIINSVLLSGALLTLTACGKTHKAPKHHHQKPMIARNITGGGKKGYFQAVHSTKQLQNTLKKTGKRPKEILLTTDLNGDTNGLLQSKLQQKQAQLQNRIGNLKHKPALKINNNVKESQKQKMNQAKQKQNQQWNNQKQQMKNLNLQLQKQKKNNQQQIKQKTSPVNIHVPSNTTLVSEPNVHTQNVSLLLHGKNIIIRNMSMQVPNGIQNYKNQFITRLQKVNGVKLEHDDFKGISAMQQQKNKNKKAMQVPTVKGIAIQELKAHHIYTTGSNFTGLASGITQPGLTGVHNQVSVKKSKFQDVRTPFGLTQSHNSLHNISVQYNKGLSLFNITNPVHLKTTAITITVKGESADNVAKQMLKMAKDTAPTYFVNQKIEINGHGYQFTSDGTNLQIKSIASPNNPAINNTGATLSRTTAIRN